MGAGKLANECDSQGFCRGPLASLVSWSLTVAFVGGSDSTTFSVGLAGERLHHWPQRSAAERLAHSLPALKFCLVCLAPRERSGIAWLYNRKDRSRLTLLFSVWEGKCENYSISCVTERPRLCVFSCDENPRDGTVGMCSVMPLA